VFDDKTKSGLLQRLPHAVCVAGCLGVTGDVNAFTLTWLTQTSFDPPVITIAVRRGSRSNQYIHESKVFSVNFLGRSQTDLAENFMASHDERPLKLGDVPFHPGVTGAPILETCAGALECNVIQIVEYGDHDVVLGEIIATESGSVDEPPLHLEDTGWEYAG